MDEAVIERVLSVAEAIPPGKVAAYGLIAQVVGIGPRQVGAILREHGSGVPWWRVTNAAGDLPGWLRAEAAGYWAAEGIQWKPSRLGCRYRDHVADIAGLRAALVEADRRIAAIDAAAAP